MVNKATKSTSSKTPSKAAATKVTRIKAADTKPNGKAVKATVVKTKSRTKSTSRKPLAAVAGPFVSIAGYFKGAWYELRQVRWPNRKATWGLTIAVLIFSAFFVVLIVLLDVLFKYLFELILK